LAIRQPKYTAWIAHRNLSIVDMPCSTSARVRAPVDRWAIRQTSRHLVVRDGDRVVADSTRPLALYESGFAPRWYVPRADVDEAALTAVDGQTFCPYKGLASYYDVGDHARAAWS
jgi:uncharacterized protein (DUF427 family)